jgi:hypothetical protein
VGTVEGQKPEIGKFSKMEERDGDSRYRAKTMSTQATNSLDAASPDGHDAL